MKKFTADVIYTLEGPPIENGIVVTDDAGRILAVNNEKVLLGGDIERHEGIIVPGFVNAHCHLELSHLHQKINPKKGLISFIKEVIALRNSPDDEVKEAMLKADEEMYSNGIVAVGDISNTAISSAIKSKSKIKYHTFIEMLGFDGSKSKEILERALALKEKFNTSNSIGLHAPYSISKELVKELTRFCKDKNNVISMHNQECEAENQLYYYKTGPFLKFFDEMGIDYSKFTAQSKNSLQSLLIFMPEDEHIILVHNTYSSLKDVYFPNRFKRKVFWCYCPSANLYIENRLPEFDFFKKTPFLITLGTDSLASNDELNLLKEMKVVQNQLPHLSLEELLKWGTINGAKALKFDDEFGSITIGKKPGLNLINHIEKNKLTTDSSVRRLI